MRSRHGSLLAVLLVVLTASILGLTFLARTGGERRLTEQLLSMERARAAGDAAIAEAFWSVQKTMNTSGSVWYRELRLPAARGAAVQPFTPVRAQKLLADLAGSVAPAPRVTATLALKAPVPLGSPHADPAEKTAYLQAEACVTIRGQERCYRAFREVRVTRTFPLAPLEAFSLWVFSGLGAGTLRAPSGFPGQAPRPLDPAVRGVLEQGWTYDWAGRRNRFPFVRERVSEYYADWVGFLARRRDASGTIRLDGVVLVADTSDGSVSGGQLDGNGALWVTDSGLRLSGVTVAAGAHPQLVVLASGKRLELANYAAGASFRADLAVPCGTLLTEAGLKLEGSIYAGRWDPAPGNALRSVPSPEALQVTLSEVTLVP
ncbi:MAG: hypothetical protein HY814_06555 [Candidatus Riflebacteria bacterium]|nr:hypothetical protein [Candidatus Riflebacteria bacterium]